MISFYVVISYDGVSALCLWCIDQNTMKTIVYFVHDYIANDCLHYLITLIVGLPFHQPARVGCF